jgi:transcriptional regulator with PAS, ATPase and Fis domain
VFDKRQEYSEVVDTSAVKSNYRFENIIGESPAMQGVFQLIAKGAPTNSTVLITGESGTGKELVARAIHHNSLRRDKPFVPVDCCSLSESLLESELFGHVKGSFTGALGNKQGLFEAADGGTLFLDEVGELPASLQVKLLRVLQEGEVRRLGSTETKRMDVRVISATNRDLESAVESGDFRDDLYYRLAVVPILLPQLRTRRDEIPALSLHLMERHRERLGIQVEGIAPDAMEVLLTYGWPGNIRELENVLERAMVLADGPRVTLEDLPESVRRPTPEGPGLSGDTDDLSVKRHGARLEKHLIQLALDRTGGNKTQAADLLELSPRALRYKIQEYGIG